VRHSCNIFHREKERERANFCPLGKLVPFREIVKKNSEQKLPSHQTNERKYLIGSTNDIWPSFVRKQTRKDMKKT